jgi:hypothetical protein
MQVAATAAADVKPVKAPPTRRLLQSRWDADKLAQALIPREQWKPWATAADREHWDPLGNELRAGLIAAGERHVGTPWQVLPANVFLEFVRNGNRSRYEALRNTRRDRLRELVLAECAEGKGRFLDEIVNGIWLTCEESWWGVPAHMGLQKRGSGLPDVTEPTIDLFAAETSAQLAWTEYLLGPQIAKVHPLVRERIALEVERRILAPYRDREDFWWMGFAANRAVNNWNPWINSNCLTCALLMEPDRTRRAQFAYKVLRSLDRFLDAYHDDGGCDEGPGYWGRAGASLFDNLELLHSASRGTVDFYGEPLVKEIGRYIYRANIHDTWYMNFADASARVNIAADLVFRYGQRIGDADMQALGAWSGQRTGATTVRGESLGRQLPALFNMKALRAATARQSLVRDVWLPGTEVMAARVKNGSADGLYLGAQGGHNAESHNHNDVGNFIVYANGNPAIIDVGVETYTAKTFSSRRYEIWTMQSAYHNCPTVNGVMQGAGRAFASRDVGYRADDNAAEFSLDLALAYPREAGIEAWRRTLRLARTKNEIEVRDAWVLQKDGGNVSLTLMTATKPQIDGQQIRLNDGVRIAIPEMLEASVEEVPIEDARLKAVWGERVYRVLLTASGAGAKRETVLRISQA